VRVKDLVGKKLKFKIARRNVGLTIGHGSELFVTGEYGELALGVGGVFRVIIDASIEAIPMLTVSYFETDENGKYMEKDGGPIKAEKTFVITGLAELNIVAEFEPADRADAA